MKFIMINHRTASTENWDEYFKMLREGSHMIGGSALDHGISLKEGVFTQAQSATITGYIVIQAEDLEAAKNIASQSPIHKAGGTVELFTLVETGPPR